MLTILVLFVGLTLATAVIAYWSDNLGKKLGKKRVSLWGMRPRTTATFLTIASSWLIMIFTLCVMLALFKPLRQALLRFDEVKANVSTLQDSKNELIGQVGSLNGQVQTLTTSFDEASGKLEQVSRELKTSSQAAKDARRERREAEKKADIARKSADTFRKSEQAAVKREQDARANLKIVSSQRDATEEERKTAQQELKVAQNELKNASLQVKNADARVQAANGRVEAATFSVTQAEMKVKNAQIKLDRVQTSLDIASRNQKIAEGQTRLAENRARTANEKMVNADAKSLKSDAASLRAEAKVKVAQGKLDQLEAQSQRLLEANARLFEENQAVGTERDTVLSYDIRVPVGFTLVARTFEQGISENEATRRLHDIFETGKDVIAPGTNKPALLPGAELRLSPQEEPLPKASDSDPDLLRFLDEDGIYDNLAYAISRSQTPLSVRLISDRNHLEGQKFLYTRFIIVPVRPALPAGFELASTTFDENLSDARLFSALSKLVEDGRRVAVQNGVTPPLSPDNPDTPDAPDSRYFYASSSRERIFETFRKVSAQGGRARVRIITDKAISTVDQLSVRFEVEPLATATVKTTAVARKVPASTSK